jgi:hypothetical protein
LSDQNGAKYIYKRENDAHATILPPLHDFKNDTPLKNGSLSGSEGEVPSHHATTPI